MPTCVVVCLAVIARIEASWSSAAAMLASMAATSPSHPWSFASLSSCCLSDLERCVSNGSPDWVIVGRLAHTDRAS